MRTKVHETETLDLRGKTITTFIAFEVHEVFAEMRDGDRVDVLTDAYPAIEADLRAWCRTSGNTLVEANTGGLVWHFTIEKGAERRTGRKLAVIVSDEGLFELLSPLGFALAAALEGNDVSLYLQARAVRVLKRGYTPKMHGAGRPFSRFPRGGLAGAGHVSPQEKVLQLHRLGGRIFVCGPSMEHFKVERPDMVLDDVTVCEYLTFMEEMSSADMQIYM